MRVKTILVTIYDEGSQLTNHPMLEEDNAKCRGKKGTTTVPADSEFIMLALS